MFLSRIPLDISNRNTLKALASPSKFHGALESCFFRERKRNLWRIDKWNHQLYFLVLTEDSPDFSVFCQQFSQESTSWETKSYDKFLQKIQNNSRWHFRLTANPTKTISPEDKTRHGKRYAHVTTAHQKNWLIRKSEYHGFCLHLEQFDVVQNQWYHFYKHNQRPVSLLSVTYEGFLEVTDTEAFRNALCYGIGHGKAYGMGLLTIMP